MERGKFIVLEGIDGSGKSSHARLLVEHMQQEGLAVCRTFEPTDGAIGTLLRRYLRGEAETSERAVATLFLADRLDHIQRKGGLMDTLAAGTHVVCDRYLYSSIAYNCASESIDWVANLNQTAHDLLAPDLVIYLDLPAETMEQRLQNRSVVEIYEKVSYQRLVRDRYRQAFGVWADKVVAINCNRPKAEVAADVWNTAKSVLI